MMGGSPMTLNPAQRAALSITLMQLEQAVAETEGLLNGPQVGITYATDVDWSDATVQALRELCRATRSHIQELVNLFNLPVHRFDARRAVVAAMSLSWTNLEDAQPDKLRRYGDVDLTLRETLAPRLERLIDQVLALQQLASRGE